MQSALLPSLGRPLRDSILEAADRFLPASRARGASDAQSARASDARLSDARLSDARLSDAEWARRARAAVFLCWLGTFWTITFAVAYAAAGSPAAGAALGVVSATLLFGPFGIRRGWALSTIAQLGTGATWLATFIVAWRTGGFESPAIVWGFFHPLTMYAVCGLRSAALWSLLSGVQIVLIFFAEMAGVRFAHDLTPVTAHAFEVSALLACIGAFGMVLGPLELARRASLAALEQSNRVIERERILGDMHDGVGSQLLGLVVELRAQRIEGPRLLAAVESCLDDLRLAVHTLDASQPSLELIFGEQRARLEARCAAAGLELVWSSAVLDPPAQLDPADVLQALRFVQEAFSNALRHAHARRIELGLRRVPDQPSEPRQQSAPGRLEIVIADDGAGFDPARVAGSGRGLAGLQLRAHRLGGELLLASSDQGTSVTLRFPG